ncbi:sigma 54-interacting transcriptional regulator [Kyrpidia sp.]|uniref:sigma-54 interaction domain-containing protein n=1 Tax=Kyrpidia sp. TaxID=2073077 RepID=UPI0025890476|nr:sigma 54-interacting transcriptional regulator [Kyrpidia sp.]MCL6577437.1 sigma 54-interacting transcriptional regulator [Kyrpidia sp.]
MDLKSTLLHALPILAKLTDGFVAVTDRSGKRLKVIDPEGNTISSLENCHLEVAARAMSEGTLMSGPSELRRGAEIWALPVGDYAIVVTDDGKRLRRKQLEVVLMESLPLISEVIGGEAALFDEIGRITHSVNRDGTVNGHLIGEINENAYSAIALQKAVVSESCAIPGGMSIFFPITKHLGVELSGMPLEAKLHASEQKGDAKYTFADLIGQANCFLECKSLCNRVAKSSSPILLWGESGTGKELFAQAVHNASGRASQRFVAVNCAAIPANLIESVLFGYEGGAFTGAAPGGKKGLILEANNGTLFLDEVGEMDLSLQSRFLRVLQEKEVMPIGGSRSYKVDVRIIAATNKDLKEMVNRGLFREDLYYRLNVVSVRIPSLRERAEDIELLAHHFIKEFNITMKKRITGLSREAMAHLKNYHWPGNVRELRNCLERAANLIDEGEITVDLLPEDLWMQEMPESWKIEEHETLDEAIRRIEKELIRQVLIETKYNKHQAAKRLGISSTTLWRKLNENVSIKRVK